MNLTLILPGIYEVLSIDPEKRFRRLEKWVARGVPDISPSQCYEQSLLDSLGYGVPDNADIPAAQCTWLTDFDESAPLLCARADPVFLKADKDHARLISAESLNLGLQEAHDLVASLNAHFKQDDVTFSVGQKGRWYVSGMQAPLPDTQPTSQVAGRNVSAFLPSSPQTARWRQLATEAQMLLHADPVNQDRESRGLQPVNSLWCWGGGKLQLNEPAREYKLYSNAAFAVGSGKLNGMRVYPLEEVMHGLPKSLALRSDQKTHGLTRVDGQTSVVILDTRLLEAILVGDRNTQLDVLDQLQNGVFADAEKMLIRGQLSNVRVDTCAGRRIELSRRNLMRFWKKARPLVSV